MRIIVAGLVGVLTLLAVPAMAATSGGFYSYVRESCAAGGISHRGDVKWLNSSGAANPVQTKALTKDPLNRSVGFVYRYQVLSDGVWQTVETATGTYPSNVWTQIHGKSAPAAPVMHSRVAVTFTFVDESCMVLIYAAQ